MTSEGKAPPVPETFEAALVSSRLVTPRVKELIFERVDGQPFTFSSGQWVSLVLPLTDEKGERLRRAYSLASVPGSSPRFELVVTRVDSAAPADGSTGHFGVGSSWLHEAKLGTKLEVKGPQGTFQRAADAGPSLFVATGTGVAPFRGMVHDALAAGGEAPLWVLFGIRSPADALYRDEFEALAKAHPRLRFLLSMSRPPPDWTGLHGYVQTHVLELWKELANHGRPQAYLCGVKKMLFEVRAVLKNQGGAERQQLHLESYD
jgi:ferredoxin-NADP reductase